MKLFFFVISVLCYCAVDARAPSLAEMEAHNSGKKLHIPSKFEVFLSSAGIAEEVERFRGLFKPLGANKHIELVREELVSAMYRNIDRQQIVALDAGIVRMVRTLAVGLQCDFGAKAREIETVLKNEVLATFARLKALHANKENIVLEAVYLNLEEGCANNPLQAAILAASGVS